MDGETLEVVKKKRKLWKKYKYCRSHQNREKYEEAKIIASRRVKEAKWKYERNIALGMKDDSKLFWKLVKSKTKVKEDIQCIIQETGEVHSENKEKAELLNHFFSSVFTQEDVGNVPAFKNRTNSSLEEVQIDTPTIIKLLGMMKKTKSQCPDDIHPKFIKESSKELAKPVSIVFRRSLDEGKLPEIWKIANVTPIHKKGPKHQVGNYRPISLTSILC